VELQMSEAPEELPTESTRLLFSGSEAPAVVTVTVPAFTQAGIAPMDVSEGAVLQPVVVAHTWAEAVPVLFALSRYCTV
jgi:hypothetical protein